MFGLCYRHYAVEAAVEDADVDDDAEVDFDFEADAGVDELAATQFYIFGLFSLFYPQFNDRTHCPASLKIFEIHVLY